MHFTSREIARFGLADSPILDVGGAPGDNLLKKFGLRNVKTLDLNPNADIVASAAEIPLADNAYPVVTCIDTFEHIPVELRTRVLNELIRVAENVVIVIAPVQSKENVAAEELVLKYRNASFLVEHRLFGLVDFDTLTLELQRLQTEGQITEFRRTEIDNLHTWICLMVEDYADTSQVYQDTIEFENRFIPRRVALVIRKK
jgi:hypothetical protein